MKGLLKLQAEYDRALDRAEVKRKAYQRGIADAHRQGVSMRELAKALGLSHQRIHQIIAQSDGVLGAETPTEVEAV